MYYKSLVNWNGQMVAAHSPLLHAQNRSFRYGDGIFETIRVFGGGIPFLEKHFHRHQAGAKAIQLPHAESMNLPFFQSQIDKVTKQAGNWRIRWTSYRGGGGAYLPRQSRLAFLIEAHPLAHKDFLNAPGLEIGIVEQVLWSKDPLAPYKTCSALPYVRASLQAQSAGWDTGLLLNERGHVTEASSANVWMLREKKLITPPLSDGPLKGIMRQFWLDHASQIGLTAIEDHIRPEDLEQADEIWLTNSISGIRWVKRMRNQSYSATFAEQGLAFLKKKIASA